MKDYAPETGRSGTKGHRTKKAKRRATLRHDRHVRREIESKRFKRRAKRIRAERVANGWWPPKPE